MSKILDKLYFCNSHFNFLKNLLHINQLPNSIIISGNGGVGKKTFLSHFLLSTQIKLDNTVNKKNDDFILNDSKSLDNVFQNKYSNIRIIQKIDKSKAISIEQIRDIISYCEKSSLDGKPKFIGIVNIENLNINASNALLKILEKPPENTFFFLLKNSENFINDTISSRCFKFNINFSIETNEKIFKELLNDYELNDFDNFKIFNNFDSAGSKIQRILYLRKNLIENNDPIDIINHCLNDYKKNKNIESLNYGVVFTKNLFLLKFKSNFKKFNKLYFMFVDTIEKSIKYNSDINPAINLLKKVI